jgi:hypothetical protein
MVVGLRDVRGAVQEVVVGVSQGVWWMWYLGCENNLKRSHAVCGMTHGSDTSFGDISNFGRLPYIGSISVINII